MATLDRRVLRAHLDPRARRAIPERTIISLDYLGIEVNQVPLVHTESAVNQGPTATRVTLVYMDQGAMWANKASRAILAKVAQQA